MVIKTIAVLDPTAKPRIKEITTASRVHGLNDKTIGFLWNSKPNGNILLLRIKEQFLQKFHGTETGWSEKFSATFAAPADTIEELTRTSDLVINAIGD